eukprot:g3453.t1
MAAASTSSANRTGTLRGQSISGAAFHAGPKRALYRYDAIGKQADSTKFTEPTAPVCLAARPDLIEVHTRGVPGPGTYALVPTVGGAQVDSTIRTMPMASLAGREKFGSTIDVREARDTPAPTDYILKNCNKDKEPKAPVYSIYSRDSWKVRTQADKNPGPSDYGDVSDAVAATREGVIRDATMPKAGREQDPVYLGQRSDNAVGPGEYASREKEDTFGKQVRSTYRNGPKYSFSVSGRRRAPIGARSYTDAADNPPPTFRYNAIGKQLESTKRSSPAATMSGRISFGEQSNVSELYTRLGQMNRLTTIRRRW